MDGPLPDTRQHTVDRGDENRDGSINFCFVEHGGQNIQIREVAPGNVIHSYILRHDHAIPNHSPPDLPRYLSPPSLPPNQTSPKFPNSPHRRHFLYTLTTAEPHSFYPPSSVFRPLSLV